MSKGYGLILGREEGETILLNFAAMTADDVEVLKRDGIQFAVADIRGAKVRLGVSAPKFVSVDRPEIALAKRLNPQVKP